MQELFQKIQNEVKVERKFGAISLECFNCFADHSFVECPELHYKHVHHMKNDFRGKAEQQRQPNYHRYGFRESKMLVPTTGHRPFIFETIANYELYYPERNLSV